MRQFPNLLIFRNQSNYLIIELATGTHSHKGFSLPSAHVLISEQNRQYFSRKAFIAHSGGYRNNYRTKVSTLPSVSYIGYRNDIIRQTDVFAFNFYVINQIIYNNTKLECSLYYSPKFLTTVDGIP